MHRAKILEPIIVLVAFTLFFSVGLFLFLCWESVCCVMWFLLWKNSYPGLVCNTSNRNMCVEVHEDNH